MFKKRITSFVKKIPVLTITQQIIKNTPLYKSEIAVLLETLVKLGIQYKAAY
jgi:hypothetical protein